MTPRSVYDTPPDGDFARYVEALGRESVARLLQAGSAGTVPAHQIAPRQEQPVSAAPQQAVPKQAMAPLWRVLLSGAALWLGYTVASTMFPALALIGWPLLFFFVLSAVRRLRGLPWTALTQAAAREAERRLRQPSRPR